MICHRCLLRATRQRHNALPLPVSFTSPRQFSRSAPQSAQEVTAEITTGTNPRPNDRPAATSTSVAQPFSNPLTPAPARLQDLPEVKRGGKEKEVVKSSVPAGTVLKGLSFMKNQNDPVAGEDGEYPGWLWGVLEAVKDGSKGGEGVEGDLFAKSKKQRRRAAKALRKQQLLHPELLQPKIPLYEQSVDLPAGDGTLEGAGEARQGREELTRSMRGKRRSKIKEDNFLKAMG